ncbi:hypothetical protein M3Y96_00641300 [Aphelenchoides besseyi]|nr:hypothetical protein M3Y96_00641300 [Aphelenchoides besseyi]
MFSIRRFSSSISSLQLMWIPAMLKGEMPKFDEQKTQSFIGTHNGKFHCDEVFGCWMLKKLPQFAGYQILRTRAPEYLERCDIVLDVGGKFDHEEKRYDHHQRSFQETMNSLSIQVKDGKLKCGPSLDYNTPLSSAGLIYAFYGREVIRELLKEQGTIKCDDSTIEFYYDRLYKNFVEAVDAVDNGIKQHDSEPKYYAPVSLQSLVEEMNPAWNDKKSNEDVQFEKAMKVVGDIFTRQLHYLHNVWMPCRDIVQEGILNRNKNHKSGRILVMKESCPWKQHLFMLEEQLTTKGELIYAVYPGDINHTNWRVQAIPVSESAEFDNRCSLAKDWWGIRDSELAELTGIKTAFFVHQNGFIGGATKYEDAILLAENKMSTEVSRWSLRNFFLIGAFALQSGILFCLYRKLKRIECECTRESSTVELRFRNLNQLNEMKALKTKLRALEVRINDTQQRTVTFAPTTTTIAPQQSVPQSLSRVTSIASTEYVDALDDWPQTFVVESNEFSADFSTALDQEPENTKVLWRLARAMYNLTSTMEKNPARKNLIHEAHKYATDAYALLPTDFDVVKWCAITSGLVCEISGNKERIKMGYEFKKYLDEALAMNTADSTLLHMRARFSYAISNLTYWERKAASLLFATPPTATIDEALDDFLAAETLKPNQWIDNLLYIGLCYLNKKDYSNAQIYLKKAIEIPPNDSNDENSIAEAKKYLKSIYK